MGVHVSYLLAAPLGWQWERTLQGRRRYNVTETEKECNYMYTRGSLATDNRLVGFAQVAHSLPPNTIANLSTKLFVLLLFLLLLRPLLLSRFNSDNNNKNDE